MLGMITITLCRVPSKTEAHTHTFSRPHADAGGVVVVAVTAAVGAIVVAVVAVFSIVELRLFLPMVDSRPRALALALMA